MAKFKKGESGNKKGRPKGYADFAIRCREWADKFGFDFLGKLAKGDDPKIKLDTTRYIIDRGYGKAPEKLTVDGKVSLEQIISAAHKSKE